MNRLNRNKVYKRPPVKQKQFKKKHNPVSLRKLAVAFLITLMACFAYIKVYPHTFEAKQTHKLQTTVQQLQDAKKLEERSQQDSSQKQHKIEELNKQLQDAQKQLEAKRSAATVYAEEVGTPEPAPAPAPAPSVTGCGSDTMMAEIYRLESGCRTGAYNEIGCRGLGQACPGSKLPCDDGDWTCQDNWFRNYAVERYGSIYNAYVFRINHNWW